jgi:hypothetical protein
MCTAKQIVAKYLTACNKLVRYFRIGVFRCVGCSLGLVFATVSVFAQDTVFPFCGTDFRKCTPDWLLLSLHFVVGLVG